MKTMRLTSPPVPYASIIHCALCGLEVHRTLPDDPTHEPGFWRQCEEQCEEHFRRHHPRRFRLWQRTGWRWAVNGFFG